NQRSWYSDGLGETGESYLVGKDLFMRSASRFSDDKSKERTASGGRRYVNTTAAKMGLANHEGSIIADGYRCREALSAYSMVEFHGLRWAVISEIDHDEAYIPVADYQNQLLLTAVVVTLLVAIVSIIVSRRFVRPIVDLTEATKLLGKGDQRKIKPASTND